MKTSSTPNTHAFAACTFEIQADGAAIQLFPAVPFKARDGRPDVMGGHWVINAKVAANVIAKAAARITDMVIDFEHQTLNTEKNGQPAPAAGWLKGASLEWREGHGLFAVNPEWVGDTAELIAARKYRYLSPVFSYDRKTGEVLELHHVGLTNNPAIDGMGDLLSLAAARFELAKPAATATEKPRVDKEALIAALGLSSDATDEDIQTALTALKASKEKVDELTTQLAAAKAQTTANPDPAKFAPVSLVEELKKDIAALRTAQVSGEVDDLVKAGLSDGRLLPAQEKWARELGTKDVAALKTYLDTTPAIAALKRQQTGSRAQVPDKVEELDDEALAMCKAMGVEPADFLATLKA